MRNRLLFTLLLLLLPATLMAATVQIPKTGQTGCWDSAGNAILCTDPSGAGQDGAVQSGAPWPNPRFVDNGDGTMTDNLTGLIWLKNAFCLETVGGIEKGSLGYINWADALTWSNNLASGSCGLNDGSVAGDWRLPNANEILSLTNAQQGESWRWLNEQGFTEVRYGSYWTSTSRETDPKIALTFNARSDGLDGVEKIRSWEWEVLGWAVRDGQHPGRYQLSKTGQTGCWDSAGNAILCTDPSGAGQDGAVQSGAPWPNPRFVDNGDGTMTDNLTGLIWLKELNCFGGWPFTEAPAIVNTLASGTCGLIDGSASGDWVLPNRNELLSLVNYQEKSYSDWLISQGFSGTNIPVLAMYWSSTSAVAPYSSSSSAAYMVEMFNGGGLQRQRKDDISLSMILPVRRGQTSVLSVTKTGTGGGTVSADLDSLAWNEAVGTSIYPKDTVVTLTATPDAASSFTGWSGSCSGIVDCQVTLSANTSVTANFDVSCVPPANLSVPTQSKTGRVKVTWDGSATTGAAYELQVDNGTGFSTIYAGSKLTYTTSGLAKGSYTFRVRATSAGYAPSAWITSRACVVL